MRPIALLSFMLALAGCGVDGEPEPPTRAGLSVSGTVSVGISGGS